MRRAVALPANATTMRDLSNAMQTLVKLERQAFSLDDTAQEDTFEDRLKKLHAKALNAEDKLRKAQDDA